MNLASWTWTLRDLAGNVVSEYTSGSGWTKDYIHRDGTLAVALHAGGTSRLFMVDHRGTPRQITPWDGSVSVRHDYHAFGEEITNPAVDTESMKFGGYRRDFCCASGGIGGDDREGGLFYASTIGRFRSVTLGEDPSSSQTWNGYAQPESGGLRLRPTPDNEACPGCPRSDMEIEVIGQVPLVGVYIPWTVWRLIIANPTRPGGGGTTTPTPPPQPQPTPPGSANDPCKAWTDRFSYNFNRMNDIAGILAPPGLALAMRLPTVVAGELGTITWLQFLRLAAEQGLKSIVIDGTKYSLAEAAVLARTTGIVTFTFAGIAWETGVAIGSAIHASVSDGCIEW